MDNKITEKIKKLLALSESSNENEAILAYQMAQELLTKHNLSLEDVQIDINILEETISTGDEWEEWKFLLYSVLAHCNFCQLLATTFENNVHRYNLVGKEHNIIVVKEMYQYLEKTVEQLCKKRGEHLNKQYEKTGLTLTDQAFESLKIGIVKGICTRLFKTKQDTIKKEMNNKIKTFFKKDTKEIVISKYHTEEHKKINQYLESKYENIKQISTDQSKYIDKFIQDGKQESKKIGLNKQIKQGD